MLLLFACVRPPLPAPPVDIAGAEVAWHDIEGVDRIDLIESCARDCPRDEHGRAVASLTTWSLDWTWIRQPAEPCVVADVDVHLDIQVELPRWEADPSADSALTAEWERYLDALRVHEEGHVALIRGLAARLEPAVTAAGCDEARPAGMAILNEIRSANTAYDDITESGRLQGASFWRTEGRVAGR